MADATPAGTTNISQANSSVNTARKATNQQVGKIAQDLGTQNDDVVAALDAIATAINALPSN